MVADVPRVTDYLIEGMPLVNKFISVPAEMGEFNWCRPTARRRQHAVTSAHTRTQKKTIHDSSYFSPSSVATVVYCFCVRVRLAVEHHESACRAPNFAPTWHGVRALRL